MLVRFLSGRSRQGQGGFESAVSLARIVHVVWWDGMGEVFVASAIGAGVGNDMQWTVQQGELIGLQPHAALGEVDVPIGRWGTLMGQERDGHARSGIAELNQRTARPLAPAEGKDGSKHVEALVGKTDQRVGPRQGTKRDPRAVEVPTVANAMVRQHDLGQGRVGVVVEIHENTCRDTVLVRRQGLRGAEQPAGGKA